jgi:hypothetical protein
MLCEMSSEGTALGKLSEDEDDGGSNSISLGQQPTTEFLTRENVLLRQQQYQNSRGRLGSTGFNSGNGFSHEPVPEESDFAVDELEDAGEATEMASKGMNTARRMSEFGVATPFRTPFLLGPENRKLENVKKAYWQTQLGFGGLDDVPQSRRHSFADVPARHGSVGSATDPSVSRESVSVESFASQYGSEFPSTNTGKSFFFGNGVELQLGSD